MKRIFGRPSCGRGMMPTLSAGTEPCQGLSSVITSPSSIFNRQSHINMSLRESFSKVKKGIKDRFKGSRRKKDRKGPGSSGERAESEESFSRSEASFAGGGHRDPEGSGPGAVGRRLSSTVHPAQRDQSEPVPTGETKISREGGVHQIKTTRTQPSHPHSDVGAVVGSGPSEKAEQVPSESSISGGIKPNGMQPLLFLLWSLIIPANYVDTASIPDHTPKSPHPEACAEPGTVTDEKRSNWKSTAFATAKLLLYGVRETADAFGPLKSVAGGLCFILENCEVWPVSRKPYV